MKKTLLSIAAVTVGVVGLGSAAIIPSAAYAEECDVNAGNLANKLGTGDVKLCSDVQLTDTFLTVSTKGTLDLNGYTLSRKTSTGSGVILVEGTAGDLTIEDSSSDKTGKIAFEGDTSGKAAAVVTLSNSDAKLTVNGGTLEGKIFGVSQTEGTSNAKITINGGEITGKEAAVALYGTGTTLNVAGGKLEGKRFAVAGNGSYTENSHITISGGKLVSTGQVGAAIYQPQSGDIKITGGSLTGADGIVARAGNLSITGGSITAKGSGEGQIGDVDKQVPLGVAVLVDNTAAGYDSDAEATISGSTEISATNKDPVLTVGGNSSKAIKVEAGVKFTNGRTVAKEYLASDDLVQDENGTVMTEEEYLWHLWAESHGTSGSKPGNSGNSNNNEQLGNQNSGTDQETPDPSTGNQTPDTTGNPNTADPIALYATIAVVALLGLSATTFATRKFNR